MTAFEGLETRRCPVCGRDAASGVPFVRRNIDPTRLTGFAFASRKTPEWMSYRLVRCRTCDTVFAAEALPRDVLAALYQSADYDSGEEAGLAAKTYGASLENVFQHVPGRRALEIGTGNGAFLETLLAAGFESVTGVEPSIAAVNAASPETKPLIRLADFNPQDFEHGSFSLICCFQTLEHVDDPRGLVTAALDLLAPGGVLALVTHDYSAWLNRTLGRWSPIVDIEHLQLFCPRSLRYLLDSAGYLEASVSRIRNTYPLRYWFRLLPIPSGVKTPLLRRLSQSRIGARPIALNVGNILTTARRPG